jgi:O-antigen/teichoic acid export membrane protein
VTRTRRIAGGAALGLANQVFAVVVGLWLTRFVLGRLGQHDYGLWLLGLQVAGYLALADVGVVAILPRQTAFAAGAPRGDADDAALRDLTGETTRVVLWQTPLVAAAGLVVWVLVPASWAALRAPLAVVILVFVAAFPLRVFPALLQGLQDLTFAAGVQFVGWALNAVLVVALLLCDARLFALAIAWAAAQLVPPLLCLWRLRRRFPRVLPRGLPHLTWPAARRQLARSTWVSVGQVAGILVSGADILIVGALLGPAAVVPYVLTGKLVTVLGNLPLLLAHTSGPALSEMRVAEAPHALGRATTALTQAVLVGSGAVACVVLAANHGFVTWWVGAGQYGGPALTVLFVVSMLVQHYGTTVVYAVYSFGHERLLALIGLAQGVVGVALSVVLVHIVGPAGAVLGVLAAAVAVTLPLALPVIARDTGTTSLALLRGLLPWAWRLCFLLGVGLTAGLVIRPRGALAVAAVAGLAALCYAAVAVPFALRPPLREYTLQVLRAVGDRLRRGSSPVGMA